MKFTRRNILLTGLMTAIASKLTHDHVRRKSARAEQATLQELAENQLDTDALLEQAFSGDMTAMNGIRDVRTAITLSPPRVPYNRAMSKLLIRCNKLTTEQYLKGKIEPNYDGNIRDLPTYDASLEGYRQIGSLIGEETEVTERVEVSIPNYEDTTPVTSPLNQVQHAGDTLTETMRQVVNLRRTIPVYFGFVLASDDHSLILLRGTQRRNEWLANLTALQDSYRNYQDAAVLSANQEYGSVHVGFAGVYYQSFHAALIDMARQLDLTLPCYVSGHSLGGALATLAVLDLALHIPDLHSQLQLYTYASPRVGNPIFVNFHSQIIPNSFRVVNLGDVIPLVPPTRLGADYGHVGQVWSFLSQNGDVLPNHLIEVYRNAIDQEIEMQAASNYQNLSII